MEFGQALHVAPKKETYDLNVLQKFMEGLIPAGLEPDFQRDFVDRSGYWRLGELTFEDVENGKEFRIKVYPSETIANKFAQPNYENPKTQSVIWVNAKKGLFDCSLSEVG